MTTEAIAQRIKKARQDADLSQEKLAQRVGVSWSTINRWESGKVAGYKYEQLLAIAGATGKTLGFLVSEDKTA